MSSLDQKAAFHGLLPHTLIIRVFGRKESSSPGEIVIARSCSYSFAVCELGICFPILGYLTPDSFLNEPTIRSPTRIFLKLISLTLCVSESCSSLLKRTYF